MQTEGGRAERLGGLPISTRRSGAATSTIVATDVTTWGGTAVIALVARSLV